MAPASCAAMNRGTSAGRIPAKTSDQPRAIVHYRACKRGRRGAPVGVGDVAGNSDWPAPERSHEHPQITDISPNVATNSRDGAKFCLTIIIYLYKLYVMSDLDAAFSALADPTRRAILARLAQGEATVNELAEPFEMTQPAISQHLKVLEEAGLIVRRVEGTKRPRRLAKAGIEAMDQWLAMLRKALETNYDRLDEVLAGMEQRKKGKER